MFLMRRIAVCAVSLLFTFGIGSELNARAEVVSLTLGVMATCPYGLPECYPGVHEVLSRVNGVKTVSPRCSPTEWTCEVQTQDGHLLDVSSLSDALKPLGSQFTLRGVEGTVDGSMVKEGDNFVLKISGSQTALTLTSITQKVQINPKTKKTYPPTSAERGAYRKLIAVWKGEPCHVRVIGPLTDAKNGGIPSTMEVRQFTVLP